MLLEEWPNMGTYDIISLPLNDKQNRNAGLAFINFTSEIAALLFCESWKKKRLAHFSSSVKKPLTITFADIQGRGAFLQHLHQTLIGKPIACHPVVYHPEASSLKRMALGEALTAMKV